MQQLTEQGLKAIAAPADVTNYEAVQGMVAESEAKVGGIDIFVSNAGVPVDGMGYRKFIESSREDWTRFVDLNMFGLMNACHIIVPGMIERGYGRIVAITSESWRAGLPMGIAAYAASKAGAVGFRCWCRRGLFRLARSQLGHRSGIAAQWRQPDSLIPAET